MRIRPLALVAALAVVVVTPPAVAQASAAGEPSFKVRDRLTSKTELRGAVTFTQPAGWKTTAGGNRHSYVSFRVLWGTCTLDLSASMRGKATSRRLDKPVEGQDTADLLGSGTRSGGVWRTQGPEVSAGEGEGIVPGLYGIASIRVAAKRYGQLRIQGIARGCDTGSADAKALLDPKGTTVGQVNRILKTATTSLRVVRVK